MEADIFRGDGYSSADLNHPGLGRKSDKAVAGETDRVLLTDPHWLARKYIY